MKNNIKLGLVLSSFAILIISWQTNERERLAEKIAKSENFQKWNASLNEYDKKARLIRSRQPQALRKKYTIQDLNKVMANAKMSDQQKSDSMRRMTSSTPEMDEAFKKSIAYNKAMNAEFPELVSLSPEERKQVVLKAIKIYDKNRNANYLNYYDDSKN